MVTGRRVDSAHHADHTGQMTTPARHCMNVGRIGFMGWIDAGTNGPMHHFVKRERAVRTLHPHNGMRTPAHTVEICIH